MSDVQILEDRQTLARMARRLNARRRGQRVSGLVLMTDDSVDADWVEAVSALPRGAAVIVRHRDRANRERLARQLRVVCRRRGVLLLISDDHQLAMRTDADGVHVPERAATRIPGLRLMKPRWIISTSTHDAGGVARASLLKPHVVLLSPLFSTGSHPGARPLGTTRLAALAARSKVPVHALGGIDATCVLRITSLPVAGIALIRGWIEKTGKGKG